MQRAARAVAELPVAIMEDKRNKQKAIRIPKTPFAFFIKLYCKQKGSSKTKYQSKIIEATKSWLSLSDYEKKQVSMKHKEFENKYKQKCFVQLKNSEPFMKLKDPRLSNVSVNTESEEHNTENRLQPDIEHGDQIEVEEDFTVLSSEQLITNVGPNGDQKEHTEIIMEPIAANGHTSRPFLEEPLPPTLKTGKDLFNILHLTDEENNVPWTTLPQLERNQYNRAVSLLKRDYIIKFKEYLECLTRKELYDYYNKTIF